MLVGVSEPSSLKQEAPESKEALTDATDSSSSYLMSKMSSGLLAASHRLIPAKPEDPEDELKEYLPEGLGEEGEHILETASVAAERKDANSNGNGNKNEASDNAPEEVS